MKDFAVMTMCFIMFAFLYGCAGYLIFIGSPGWGWFLLCVFLFTANFKVRVDDNKKEKDEKDEGT